MFSNNTSFAQFALDFGTINLIGLDNRLARNKSKSKNFVD